MNVKANQKDTVFGVFFWLVVFPCLRRDGFKLRLTDSFSARRDSRATQQFTGLLRLTPSSEDPPTTNTTRMGGICRWWTIIKRDSNPERAKSVKKNMPGACFLAFWCEVRYRNRSFGWTSKLRSEATMSLKIHQKNDYSSE